MVYPDLWRHTSGSAGIQRAVILHGHPHHQEYEGGDGAGTIDVGGRVGVLADLNEGSLRFFVNDVQCGPGYLAGSVTGPMVCAVQLCAYNTSAQLLRQDGDHALLQ
jgi:hypothetical protein